VIAGAAPVCWVLVRHGRRTRHATNSSLFLSTSVISPPLKFCRLENHSFRGWTQHDFAVTIARKYLRMSASPRQAARSLAFRSTVRSSNPTASGAFSHIEKTAPDGRVLFAFDLTATEYPTPLRPFTLVYSFFFMIYGIIYYNHCLYISISYLNLTILYFIHFSPRAPPHQSYPTRP
jgi:hypothetical protein